MFESIHLIYAIPYSAEGDYVKRFFRTVGCQVFSRVVDDWDPHSWYEQLCPKNHVDGLDIVMNYYPSNGIDPHSMECRYQGIRRLYLYFDAQEYRYAVSEEPLSSMSATAIVTSKADTRENAILGLIGKLWEDDPGTQECVKNLFEKYADIWTLTKPMGKKPAAERDDLYAFLSAKRCLRVLNMGEVLQEPVANVQRISLEPYVNKTVTRFYQMYQVAKSESNIHGYYCMANMALNIWFIRSHLYESDRSKIDNLLPTRDAVETALDCLLHRDPNDISVNLLYAKFREQFPSRYQTASDIYEKLLRIIPTDKPDYSYIWYRQGHYYEKKTGNQKRALECYHKAVMLNPGFYQAAFKLGYYAAAAGKFKEAETRLRETVQIIFHGRDPGPGANDRYPNWDTLSLKDCQYAYKCQIILAKVALSCDREYSAQGAISSACLAASRFEDGILVAKLMAEKKIDGIKNPKGSGYEGFINYHLYSTPVWCIWKVLSPWSEHRVRDNFVRHIVRGRLAWWE